MLKEKQIPVLTAQQMKEVDALALKSGLSVLQMMEHAALQMARFIQQRFPKVNTILILAGTGHNGADGIACARFLKNFGYEPVILLSHPKEKLKEIAHRHLDMAEKMQIAIHSSSEPSSAYLFKETDLIIDALIGYALKDDPREPIATLIKQANESYKPVVAFDNPSGLDVTIGKAHNPCIKADDTLTLALPKVGLCKKSAIDYVGELYVADLGIPKFVYDNLGITMRTNIFREHSIRKI